MEDLCMTSKSLSIVLWPVESCQRNYPKVIFFFFFQISIQGQVMDFHPFYKCCLVSQNILAKEKMLNLSFIKLSTTCSHVNVLMETTHLFLERSVTKKMSWYIGAMVLQGLFIFWPKLILPGKMINTCRPWGGVLILPGRRDCYAKGQGYVMVWQVMHHC